jgi:Sec7-like guanine-nucleotide exchange factor
MNRKTEKHFVSKEEDKRKSELNELIVKHNQSAITVIKQLIQSHMAVLIFAPGRSTTLIAAKIHQTLSATKHTVLNLHQPIRYKTEVMLLWKSMFDVLLLDSQGSTENLQDVFIFPNECGVKKPNLNSPQNW